MSMILPYIEYGNILYNGANQNMIDTQNKALRTCFNIGGNNYGVDRLHQMAKLATLNIHEQGHLRNFMYKQQGNINLIDNKLFQSRARDVCIFKVTKPRIEKYKLSPLYRRAIDWNGLPPSVRNINNYSSFKFGQKKCQLSIRL